MQLLQWAFRVILICLEGCVVELNLLFERETVLADGVMTNARPGVTLRGAGLDSSARLAVKQDIVDDFRK